MVDFNVEGLITAQETVSEAVNQVSSALQGASESAEDAEESTEDAAAGFTELVGASEALESSIGGTEKDLEQINDELEELDDNSAKAAVALSSVSAANIGNIADDISIGDDFVEQFEDQIENKFGTGKASAIKGMAGFGGGTPLSNIPGILEDDVDQPEVNEKLSEIVDDSIPELAIAQQLIKQSDIEQLPDVLETIVSNTDIDESELAKAVSGTEDSVSIPETVGVRATSQSRKLQSFGVSTLEKAQRQIDLSSLRAASGIDADIPDPISARSVSVPRGLDFEPIDTQSLTGGGTSVPRRFARLSKAINESIPLVHAYTDSQKDANNAAGDGADTFDQLRNVIGKLLPELSSLSANIGPFTIGLSNLAVAVPSLIATIGLLVTVLGGLVTAILAVVAAFGAFFALGVLSFAEQLEAQFAGVTNRLEALEAIAKGAAAAFRDALAPLENAEFAGLGAAEFFIRILQDFIAVVNATAKVLAELLGLEAVEEFFFRIEEALLTANEAGGETVSFIGGLTEAVNVFLPVITDFIVALINGAPEALSFAADIGEEVLPALEEFGKALLNVTVQLTRFGAIVAQTVLPVLSNLLNALAVLGATLVFIADTAPGLSAAFLAFLATVAALTIAITALVGAGSLLVTAFTTLASTLSVNAVLIAKLVGAIGLLVGGLTLAADGFAQMLAAAGLLEPTINGINVAISVVTDTLAGFSQTLGSVIPQTGLFARILQFLGGFIKLTIGLFIAAKGALLAYTVATTIASKATFSFGGATVFANMSLTTLIGRAAVAAIGLVGMAAGAFKAALGFGTMGTAGVGAITSITAALTASGLLPIVLAISAALAGIIVLFKVLEDVVEAILDPNEEADWLRRLNGDLATTVDTLQTITSLVQDIQEFGQIEPTRADTQRAIDVGRDLFPSIGSGGLEKILIDQLLKQFGLAGATGALTAGTDRQNARSQQPNNVTVNIDSRSNGRKSDFEKQARTAYRRFRQLQRLANGN